MNNKEKSTFKNTVEALEYSGKRLDVISNIFFNLNGAETSPEMQKLAQELSPMITKHGNDVFLNFVLHLPGNESFFCLDPHPYRFYLDPESVSKLCLNPDLQENFSDPGSGSATVFNRTIK